MTADDPLRPFHPVIAEWFGRRYGKPTEVQELAWPSIGAGRHTLIAAPTGSGKTLAALLPAIDGILRAKAEGLSGDAGVKLLYITPLKALNNDIHHHVVRLAEELAGFAAQSGAAWPGLSAAVRTGDTPPRERARMLRRPPDVLVTTPESFYLLLTSEKSRLMLRSVETVVVDEIHDLAAGKRGVHLSLSLERLEALCGRPFLRIGMSATQRPLERVAAFLGGRCDAEGPDRPVHLVESRAEKKLELSVGMVEYGAAPQDRENVWQALLERIWREMEGQRTTLIFVNSRRLCERLAQRLNEFCGGMAARAHHGSVSREQRLEAERMLRDGELRCLVATSSLELGIDIGHIDRVIQIDSPLSAASGIQRFGRAGHGVGEVSRGLILARRRGDLPEIAVLADMIRKREIEPVRIPRGDMDVLAQQVAAMASLEEWPVDRLFSLIRRSDCYRDCTMDELEEVLRLLSGFYPFLRPLIEWDRRRGVIRARPGTRMAAIAGAGTIPGTGNFPVYNAEGTVQIGELDEEFVHESRVGDLFQLGAQNWIIREIRHDRVVAGDASHRYGEIPFWRNEGGGRPFAVGERIGELLAALQKRLEDGEPEQETAGWLREQFGFDAAAAGGLIGLVREQLGKSAVPTHRRIVVERYPGEAGQRHIVLHNPFGRAFNRAWQLALERLLEGQLPYPPYMCAKNGGLEIVLREEDADKLDRLWRIPAAQVRGLVWEAVSASAAVSIRFRRMAEVALVFARRFSRMPTWQRRLRGQELMRAALDYGAGFPLLAAAVAETVREQLDVPGLERVLDGLENGNVETVYCDSAAPSPFAAQFIFDYVNTQLYEAEVPAVDLHRHLHHFGRELAERVFGPAASQSAIDPEVLEEERANLEGTAASAEELYALLKRRGDLSLAELEASCGGRAEGWLRELAAQDKVAAVVMAGERRFICGDERDVYARLPEDPQAVSFVLSRYMDQRLSFAERELAERYALPAEQVRRLVREWSKSRRIEPSPFPGGREGEGAPPRWSSRNCIERVMRRSLRKFREAGRRVDGSRLALLPLVRHRLVADARVASTQAADARPAREDDLRQAMALLQGMFLPITHWERYLLPARIAGYAPGDLDRLCAGGELVWIGRREPGEKEGRIAFFLADSGPLLRPFLPAGNASAHPELVEWLRRHGASFLTRIAAETGEAPSELLPKLFDLVWEGRVSNDQFDPVRRYIRSRGRFDPKYGSGFGRWYLTETLDPGPAVTDEDCAVRWMGQLDRSFGVITRDLAAAYIPYAWEQAARVLGRLEELGVVARGMFVEEAAGLQFMNRETLAALRRTFAARNAALDAAPGLPEAAAVSLVHAADPANLYGTVISWPDAEGAAFSRKPGNYLLYRRQEWIAWIENSGRKVTTLGRGEPVPPQTYIAAIRQLMTFSGKKKVVVERWNSRPAAATEEGRQLLRLGAERDGEALVFWPSALRQT